MSLERVLKALVGLGLSQMEAEVYLFLAKQGPTTARNTAEALQVFRQQLYPCLRKLRTKEIVTATNQRPCQFSAIPFAKLFDLLVKAHLDEANSTEQNRGVILSEWRSMIKRGQAPAEIRD